MEPDEARDLLAWMHEAATAVQDHVGRAITRPDYGRRVGMGADGTPTLAIDRSAERVVLDMAADAPQPLNIVSEEAPRVDRGAPLTLLLDPVDGSRNIVRKIPFYAVSMAVGRRTQRDVTIALVRNLATGQEYTAIRGQGARLDDAPIRVRDHDPDEVIVATQLKYEKEVAAKASASLHVRSMGAAALETCLVAQGAFDVFLSRAPYLRIVDISAAALVLEEAGGQALGPDGRPFDADYDIVKRHGFIGVGDPKVLELVL